MADLYGALASTRLARFVDTCQSARMWQSWLLSGERFPYWFEAILDERLNQTRYIPNAEEAGNVARFLRGMDAPSR